MNGHDDEKRKVVYAKVCAPGAELLRAFCMNHGVSTAGFLDGLSHILVQWSETTISELEDAEPNIAAALLFGRQIDADRRNREPRQAQL
jgi:hypothetical protein